MNRVLASQEKPNPHPKELAHMGMMVTYGALPLRASAKPSATSARNQNHKVLHVLKIINS